MAQCYFNTNMKGKRVKKVSHIQPLEGCHNGLLVSLQGHKIIQSDLLPIYTHMPNLKGLPEIFFELLHMKGNLHRKKGQKVNVKRPHTG